jgi:hypothetical protein
VAALSLAQLTNELKANPRLRGGLWLCIAILWFYGIVNLQEASVAKAKEYETLVKRSARSQATADQKAWQGRVDEAREIERSLAKRLWHEPTQGLAQAAFQDWLVQALQQGAILKPQMTVVAQEGPKAPGAGKGYDEMWKVSARVAFDFDPKTFTPFIDKLAGHEKWIGLETLNVRSSPSPRAEMTLVAYFSKGKE